MRAAPASTPCLNASDPPDVRHISPVRLPTTYFRRAGICMNPRRDDIDTKPRRIVRLPTKLRHRPDPSKQLEDLEFSDYGRSRRFGPGWWIVPTLIVGAALSLWAVL
jgi:hypothetical protein